MRLDNKSIIIKRYALRMSGAEIAEALHVRKSGVNGFLRAFKKSEEITFPLPPRITSDGIYALVYQEPEASTTRDTS